MIGDYMWDFRKRDCGLARPMILGSLVKKIFNYLFSQKQ